MTKSEIIKFLIWRTIGNFLVLLAVFGVVATFGPALYYEVEFRFAQANGVRYIVSENPLIGQEDGKRGFAAVLSGKKEQVLAAKDVDFSVVIPKIGASAKVIPNVDASDESVFLPALQKGVAHARGTVFPGMKGNIYLFAHSTDNFWNVGRYNAVFYLLKDVSVGDDVILFFENVRHNYKVAEVRIVDAQDVELLTKSQESKEEKVILQTCWPPGTTWKRLIVIAKPK